MAADGSINGIILDDNEERGWLVTYADLMTLLLVFFILLYSISSLNMEKFKRAIQSIQVSLGETSPRVGLLDLVNVPESKDQNFTIEDLTGLRAREQDMLESLNEVIADKNQSENILVYAKDGKITIQIRGAVLFASGSARFNEMAKPILDEIVNIIHSYPAYNANIKGHTDDVPIETVQFPSNWELSSARASSVVRYLLRRNVQPEKLRAVGFADTKPIRSNFDNNGLELPENQAHNRRVEIIFLADILF